MFLRHPVSCVAVLLCIAAASPAAEPRAVEQLNIAPVWSGHPVDFDLLTHPPHQFVAYYDHQRQMTIAHRTLDSQKWSYHILPSPTAWDSHNYITLAIDSANHLHLSGNMHCVPLIYFRTTKPLDPSSFDKIPQMVGQNEQRCTYPQFLTGPKNEFIFTYRDGSSGSGNQIYNVYDVSTKTWKRLLDTPLTDGQGNMNAYAVGPVRSPDGLFHLCWVWRDTGDCATNHDLSYARSKDLIHWETSAGKPLPLPMTLQNSEIVDPVPPGGGMINGNTILGFDKQNRPLIAYHKFDKEGNTQLHLARADNNAWTIQTLTDWTYRWNFSGGGAIIFEIHLGPITLDADGSILVGYSHAKVGSGLIKADAKTLAPLAQLPRPRAFPAELARPESTFPDMKVHWQKDATPNTDYWLRWETLPANRDKAREKPWPEPTMLRLYQFAPEAVK